MEKKGSITVFLALILSILLSLVSASLQSVQAAATRTQILNGMDIGLYSLFGQYDRSLLRDYDLFFLDGTQGGTELNLAAVYDNLESYIKPVLKQNGRKLRIKQGGFTGYRLATDQNGEVLYHQAEPRRPVAGGRRNQHRKGCQRTLAADLPYVQATGRHMAVRRTVF